MTKLRILVSGLSLVAAATVANGASAAGYMTSNGVLFEGQLVWAADCSNHLAMQTDGNLVLYRGYSTAVWNTNTGGSGWFADFQEDGNFVVYNGSLASVWSSGTDYFEPTLGWGLTLNVQTDGNLVAYTNSISGGQYAYWWTNTVGYASHPSSCQSSWTHVFYDITTTGTTLSSNFASNEFVCGDRCAQNSSCKAWVFQHLMGLGYCTLKSSYGTRSASSGKITGEIAH